MINWLLIVGWLRKMHEICIPSHYNWFCHYYNKDFSILVFHKHHIYIFCLHCMTKSNQSPYYLKIILMYTKWRLTVKKNKPKTTHTRTTKEQLWRQHGAVCAGVQVVCQKPAAESCAIDEKYPESLCGLVEKLWAHTTASAWKIGNKSGYKKKNNRIKRVLSAQSWEKEAADETVNLSEDCTMVS